MNEIVDFLFSTEAIKVSSPEEMFLFTSGLIGPYYVNTHFLAGGETEATKMLSYIDSFKGHPKKIVSEVGPKILELASRDQTYTDVLNLLKGEALAHISSNKVDFISGGERRDWFFSIPLAKELNIPHLYLFNDQTILDEAGEPFSPDSEVMQNSIHIADLLTVGSSYVSKWLPALRSKNVGITLSLNCVDRDQSGEKNLLAAGVKKVVSLCKINEDLFETAYKAEGINLDQRNFLKEYFQDQFESMRNFLISRPGFVEKQLESEGKSRSRILLTLQNDLYKLGLNYVSQFKF